MMFEVTIQLEELDWDWIRRVSLESSDGHQPSVARILRAVQSGIQSQSVQPESVAEPSYTEIDAWNEKWGI